VQRSYTAAVNYQTPGMRLTQVRAQASTRRAAARRSRFAASSARSWWSATSSPGRRGSQAAPNPAVVEDRLRQLWTTPHGVIKAALANAGRVDGSTITFSVVAAPSRRRSTSRTWSIR